MSIFKKSSVMPIARTTIAFPNTELEPSPGLPDYDLPGAVPGNAANSIRNLLDEYSKKITFDEEGDEVHDYWTGFRDALESALRIVERQR